MGSEDFAVISAKIPASYFVVGAGVEDQSKWKGQHNPKILFNEKALPLGAAHVCEDCNGLAGKIEE